MKLFKLYIMVKIQNIPESTVQVQRYEYYLIVKNRIIS